VDAWCGVDEGHKRALAAREKEVGVGVLNDIVSFSNSVSDSCVGVVTADIG